MDHAVLCRAIFGGSQRCGRVITRERGDLNYSLRFLGVSWRAGSDMRWIQMCQTVLASLCGVAVQGVRHGRAAVLLPGRTGGFALPAVLVTSSLHCKHSTPRGAVLGVLATPRHMAAAACCWLCR